MYVYAHVMCGYRSQSSLSTVFHVLSSRDRTHGIRLVGKHLTKELAQQALVIFLKIIIHSR